MKILVTGCAGFIGSVLSIKLLERGAQVIGIDNHNDYYDPALKEARLARHTNHENYTHLRIDIPNPNGIVIDVKNTVPTKELEQSGHPVWRL
jgi:UDP-glucuronate 4-epimerase